MNRTMKAKIKMGNEVFVIEGEYLNEVQPETTWFSIPKEDAETITMIEAVKRGALKGMTDINGRKWLVSVKTNLIEWED